MGHLSRSFYISPGVLSASQWVLSLDSLSQMTFYCQPIVRRIHSFSIRLYQSLCSFSIRLYQSLYFCRNLILLTILKPTLSSHCPSLTSHRRTPTIHRYCQRVQCHRLTVATFTNVANKLQLQLPASWSLRAVMLLLWNISLVCS